MDENISISGCQVEEANAGAMMVRRMDLIFLSCMLMMSSMAMLMSSSMIMMNDDDDMMLDCR